jgi:SAM-dependent methyltransferase
MFDSDIDDITYYNKEMCKSLIDKAFFLDKVDANIFVDFGCADGSLIAFIKHLFPKAIVIGYDISKEMLAIAATKVDAPLFSDWDEVIQYIESIRTENSKTAVVCNSLIHEVYAYGDETSITKFWDNIYNSGFDYIVIRDMCVSDTVNRPSDSIAVANIRQKYDRNRLREFEAEWGVIDSNWSLIHFLLKYRYVTNWKREVKENYLPLSFEELLQNIPSTYTPEFVDHFILPFTRSQAYKSLGVTIADNTHIKLILKAVK